MLVSVVINNHNYARYLSAAIDGALAQTWQPLEVVVVDDGSIDESWMLILSYGERVRAIRQANAGQGAAYNACFAASRGDWVLFLDADDLLDPDAVERMMAAAGPDVAKVQCFLRYIGSDGDTLGGSVPYIAHDGDVTPIARRFGHYAGPPASGNLYRRSAIEPYFPMPAEVWRRGADTVPFVLSAFHGRVATVNETLGSYRLHTDRNTRNGVLGNRNRSLADALRQSTRRRSAVQDWGSRCGRIAWTPERAALPWDWRMRVLSWRLQRPQHPFPEDDRRSIWDGLNRSLAEWPGYTRFERLLQRGWIAVMLALPRPLVAALASSNVAGGLRERLRLLRGGGAA